MAKRPPASEKTNERIEELLAAGVSGPSEMLEELATEMFARRL